MGLQFQLCRKLTFPSVTFCSVNGTGAGNATSLRQPRAFELAVPVIAIMRGFPKIRATLLGVPIRWIITFSCYIGVPLFWETTINTDIIPKYEQFPFSFPLSIYNPI